MKASDIGERYKPVLALFAHDGHLVIDKDDARLKKDSVPGRDTGTIERVLLNGKDAGYWSIASTVKVSKLFTTTERTTYVLTAKGREMIHALDDEVRAKRWKDSQA